MRQLRHGVGLGGQTCPRQTQKEQTACSFMPGSLIRGCLKVSGAKGVYAILKTEDKRTDLSCSCVVGHANP